MKETPQEFLSATAFAIEGCQRLVAFALPRIADQWRPDPGLVRDALLKAKGALIEVIDLASEMQNRFGHQYPDWYREVFNQDPDPRDRATITREGFDQEAREEQDHGSSSKGL